MMFPLLALLACAPSPYTSAPEITNIVDDWRDRTIYQVLTDRFTNGDGSNDINVSRDPSALARYQGGDWEGLIERVDYLDELGVNAIWISPVFRNVEEDAGVSSYHGYWPQSFRDTNPHFGDLAKLRELVDVMHQHDIAVVFDVIVNHVGQLFYYDINMNGRPDITDYYATDGSGGMETVTEWDPGWDPEGIQAWTTLGYAGPAPVEWLWMPELNRVPPEPPEFADETWYHRKGRVEDWNDFDQVVEGDFPGGLKDLATENPNVRNALIAVWSDWIRETDADGFRIDTVKHVEYDFWPVFCGAIRAFAHEIGKDDFLIFGESFDGDDALVGSYTEAGMLDSAAYFPQKYQVFDDVFKYGQATRKVEELYAQRADNWGTQPQEGGVGVAPVDLAVNFMDNHDTARFLFDAQNADLPDPEAALRGALTFLFTTEGLPVLYYGTEQGFDGGNDPANREPLWWSGLDTSGELFGWTKRLIALRKAHPALTHGELRFVWSSDSAGLLAFERDDGDELLLVAINTADSAVSETVGTSFAGGSALSDLLGRDGTWSVANGGTVDLTLEPREVVVLGG
ncbi:MAG: alpha-amylase family glycosyl hydrolase [Pseudomonadota bacterium]